MKVVLCALGLTVLTVLIHAVGTLFVTRRINDVWSKRSRQPGMVGGRSTGLRVALLTRIYGQRPE